MLVTENGALGLQKNHGLRGNLVAQLAGVVGVIPADANDFHARRDQSLTKNDTSTRLSKAPRLDARSSPK